MTSLEELDLARAKAMFEAAFPAATVSFDQCNQTWKDAFLCSAEASRLSDESRGLRVVPVEPTEGMLDAAQEDADGWRKMPYLRDQYRFHWSAMLSASPYAPEEK